MCDCECCRTRCTSTYDRPRWGLPGWCGCTCGNCIAVYASEAYDAGRESLRGEVERLTAALADRDRRIAAALDMHVAERAKPSPHANVGVVWLCKECSQIVNVSDQPFCPTGQALRGES